MKVRDWVICGVDGEEEGEEERLLKRGERRFEPR